LCLEHQAGLAFSKGLAETDQCGPRWRDGDRVIKALRSAESCHRSMRRDSRRGEGENRPEGLILASSTRGRDPTRLPGREGELSMSIANFDKDRINL
jgi:hypothetical protein